MLNFFNRRRLPQTYLKRLNALEKRKQWMAKVALYGARYYTFTVITMLVFMFGCLALGYLGHYLYASKKSLEIECKTQASRDNELIRLHAGTGASFSYYSKDAWKTEKVVQAAAKALKE